uniref:eukaryotic translation initiation factor 4E family member 1c isoform X2 n=1 Tax=Doryrhamphus excisus TaxID=161450 RepID=UPI0025ADAC6F|nr:eukaryotic translation initiation factor 4E family member 1c isoform X2 [Doryrhamphus excisus]XP_057910304.1 eukaryotic translation initiation factor 4E family member 1c isoform X2 [Doryrhamphus excisus]XP_057910314.1 eukaryotic translation initiation factor 4E family member 1c isoform X2 [Doryrhamphus excisus]
MATSEPKAPETEEPQPPPPQPQPQPDSQVVSQEPYIKHPLQNKWALWYFKNDKSKSWTENLRLIYKFDTVEDFWALYNHIQQPSKLGIGCDYCLFKDGIKPMWEDDRNKLGGRWLITLNKQQRHNDLDRYWMETLLCLVGESFNEASEDVCGAVVNIRHKGDKLAIWTSNCQNRDAIMTIGQLYKDCLKIPIKAMLGYQSHDDTSSKSGSTTKNMYTV